MNPQIQELERIIATSTDPDTIALAKKRLESLASVGSANVQLAAQDTSGQSDDLKAILVALQRAIAVSGGGAVSQADFRKFLNEELKIRKISENDLSTDLLAMINSSRSVNLTVNKLFGVSLTQNVKAAMLQRPLTQKILTDLMARNNVYLYGGAGTGKTYMAEEIADMLGWERITLNCNQFTSPLDILGGQTIDGYQEGKLSMAWSNMVIMPDGSKKQVAGAVLILDELPKIDPNTAGILNEALAKVKDFKYNEATKAIKPPTIRNGKNEELPLGNLFVIATGNVPLNTIDPDYEANFKQDLSLQDRFIGSTYRVFVDLNYEFNDIMKGFAFIWIFLTKVRKAVVDARATGQAFVSLRLMINVKATYCAYRAVVDKVFEKKGNISSSAITNPKTIIESLEDFFGLFKPTTRELIEKEVDFEGFKRVVAEKNKMPFNADAPDFNTQAEIIEAQNMIRTYQQ
jgi:cobaltochelatase CobS